VGKGGKIEDIALGMTGVASKAYRAGAVEKALRGKIASETLIAEACAKAGQGVEPLSDIFALAEYRREMASVFARRAIASAIEKAMPGKPAAGTSPSPKGKRR